MKKLVSYAMCFSILLTSLASVSFAKGGHLPFAKPTKDVSKITSVSEQDNDEDKDEDEDEDKTEVKTATVEQDKVEAKTETEDAQKAAVTEQVYNDSTVKQNIADLHKKLVNQDKILKQYLVSAKKLEKSKDIQASKAQLATLEQNVNAQKELNKGYADQLKAIVDQFKEKTNKGKIKLKQATVVVKELERETKLLNELDKKIINLKAKFDPTALTGDKKANPNRPEKLVKEQKGNGKGKGHK